MVRAEPTGSRETNAQEKAFYEITHFSFDADAVCLGRLRRRTGARDHNDDHGSHYHDWAGRGSGHPRGVGDTSSASCSGRGANCRARTEICLDQRILALDWSGLSMGVRHVGAASQTGCGLGGRALGTTTRRLDLDRRPLAIVKSWSFPWRGELCEPLPNGVAELQPCIYSRPE